MNETKKIILIAGLFLWLTLIAMYITEKVNGNEISNRDYMKELNEYVVSNRMVTKYTQKYEKATDEPIKPEYDIALDVEIQDYIWEQSLLHNWDWDLILGISFKESRFDVTAYNNSNSDGSVDSGLMQINSSNIDKASNSLGYEIDVNNYKHNVDAAIWLLNYLRDKYKSQMSEEQFCYFVILAYRQGEASALNDIETYGFWTDSYVADVLKYKEQLERYGTINE